MVGFFILYHIQFQSVHTLFIFSSFTALEILTLAIGLRISFYVPTSR